MKRFILTVVIGFVFIIWILAAMVERARQNEERQNVTALFEHAQKAADRKARLVISDEAGRFKAPFRPGDVESFYADGSLSARWQFDDDLAGGTLTVFHENTQVWMRIPFAEGKPHGTLQSFDGEGRLRVEEIYENGRRLRPVTFYYPGGGLWVRWGAEVSGTDLPEVFSENGIRQSLEILRAEDAAGYFKAFDQNGRVISEWQRDGGRDSELLRAGYQNGQESARFTAASGVLEGPGRLYYPNGRVFTEFFFKAGRFEGSEKVLDPEGNLRLEKIYNGEGALVRTKVFYRNGFQWFTIEHWDEETGYFPKLYSEILVSATVEA